MMPDIDIHNTIVIIIIIVILRSRVDLSVSFQTSVIEY